MTAPKDRHKFKHTFISSLWFERLRVGVRNFVGNGKERLFCEIRSDSHARHGLVFISPQMGCRRMAANGLGIILFRYADWLLEKGYSRSTIHLYTQAVEHFGFWRAKHHARSQSVQVSEVTEFLNSHLSRCDCPPPAATHLQTCRSALNRFMSMLGCRKSSWQSCEGEGPAGTLVADFDQHLRKVCGLSPATRFYRRRYAREFLK
jgi:hypothetical protein